MKFYCDLPWGGHLYIERKPRKPREPMQWEKFLALVFLAAGALLVFWFLGGVALK